MLEFQFRPNDTHDDLMQLLSHIPSQMESESKAQGSSRRLKYMQAQYSSKVKFVRGERFQRERQPTQGKKSSVQGKESTLNSNFQKSNQRQRQFQPRSSKDRFNYNLPSNFKKQVDSPFTLKSPPLFLKPSPKSTAFKFSNFNHQNQSNKIKFPKSFLQSGPTAEKMRCPSFLVESQQIRRQTKQPERLIKNFYQLIGRRRV